MSRPTLDDPADDALIAAHYRKDQPMTLQTHHRARGTRPEPLFQRMARLRMEREPLDAPDAAERARAERLDAWREAIRRDADERALIRRVAMMVVAGFIVAVVLAVAVRFW